MTESPKHPTIPLPIPGVCPVCSTHPSEWIGPSVFCPHLGVWALWDPKASQWRIRSDITLGQWRRLMANVMEIAVDQAVAQARRGENAT